MNQEEVSFRLWYEAFQAKAMERFHWPVKPLPFEEIQSLVVAGLLNNVITPYGFLLERLASYQTREWLVVYLPNENPDAFHAMMQILCSRESKSYSEFTLINWAMTGPAQQQWVRYLPRYGFKLAGQMVLCWDLTNPLTLPVFETALRRQTALRLTTELITEWLPPNIVSTQLPESILTEWATLVVNAFESAPDVRWDIRFRCVANLKNLLCEIHHGLQGTLVGTMVTKTVTGQAVGICWIVESTFGELNIPILAVSPQYQNQGIGGLLLQETLCHLVKQGQVKRVHVTTSTEQHQATRLYRRLGFRETDCYTMAYQ